MSHHTNDEGSAARPLRDQRGLVNRVRRLRGQVEAIERALAGEASCTDLLQRITAARGAINGLMAEVLEESSREYLLPADSDGRSSQGRGRRGANRNHPLLSDLTVARRKPGSKQTSSRFRSARDQY